MGWGTLEGAGVSEDDEMDVRGAGLGGRLAGAFWGPHHQHQPQDEAVRPTTPKHPRPHKARRENMGFPGGSWGHLEQLPQFSPTLGSRLPVRHSNGVQQERKGCRLSARAGTTSLGSGCRASHPRLPGVTQPPGTNNPHGDSRPGVTHHQDTTVEASRAWAQGLWWDLGSCPGRF